MRRLVEFPSETGEPILVEVEDAGFGGETRRGLSASAVVDHPERRSRSGPGSSERDGQLQGDHDLEEAARVAFGVLTLAR
jgi:hypothetical protein